MAPCVFHVLGNVPLDSATTVTRRADRPVRPERVVASALEVGRFVRGLSPEWQVRVWCETHQALHAVIGRRDGTAPNRYTSDRFRRRYERRSKLHLHRYPV